MRATLRNQLLGSGHKLQIAALGVAALLQGVVVKDVLAQALSVEPEPTLVLGRATGAAGEEFFRVSGAVRTPTGAVVVANTGYYALSVFDKGGELLRTIGRQGAGPGEFTHITKLDLWDDTIVVWDWRLSRLTLFDEHGLHLSDYALPRWGGRPTEYIGRLPSGDLLLSSTAQRRTPHGVSEEYSDLLRFSRRSGLLTSVVELFMRQSQRYVEGGGSTTYRMPFAPTALVAATNDGFAYTNGTDPVVSFYTDAGVVARTVRLPLRPQVDQRTLARAYVDSLSRQSGPSERRRLEQAFSRIAGGAPGPLFRSVHTAPSGQLWLEEYPHPRSSSVRWYVVDASSVAARVQVPAHIRVLSVGRSEIIALTSSSDGVEQVVTLRVIRRR